MKNRKIIKTVAWSVCILMVLLLTTIIHIAMVTKPYNLDNNNLQLSRIDFIQDLDSAEAQKIKSFACSLPGVKNASLNFQQKTLVVGYLNTIQTSDNLLQKIIEYGHYKAVKYCPSEQNSGCPLGYGSDSFATKITAFVHKWFN